MVALAIKNWRHGIAGAPEGIKELTMEDDRRIIGKYRREGMQGLSEFEKVALAWVVHEAWFVEMEKRCPGCGEGATPVGSNFRVPKRRDEKGWRKVEVWIEEGRDLVATFVNCATVEQHEERVEKAIEMRKERGVEDAPYPGE